MKPETNMKMIDILKDFSGNLFISINLNNYIEALALLQFTTMGRNKKQNSYFSGDEEEPHSGKSSPEKY